MSNEARDCGSDQDYADEVLVGGSWFKRAELPTILANYMRSSDEYARQAKDVLVTLTELRSTVITGDMVERAAIAVGAADLPHWTWRENELSGIADEYRKMARAALEAALGARE